MEIKNSNFNSMKKIIIFGGSGGLGKQLAELMKADCDVIAVSSDDCDITSFAECNSFLSGRQPDVVINLAGINYDKMLHKIDLVDSKQVKELIDVNVTGAVNIVANCLPGMRKRGYGRIIMISSILSIKDVPGTAIYSGSKAFVDRFVKNISAENISKGITANSIQCGYMDGGLTYKMKDAGQIRENLPLKRFGTIEELYSAIDFFIKTEYVTGINLNLSGGL
jgi:3-oxoacyl-[acyl-carrier protein] reductase